MSTEKRPWFVYIVRCADGTLYTGCTRNVARRLAAHNAGRGARYTRGRRPVTLVGAQPCPSQAVAMALERRIKTMSPERKVRSIADEDVLSRLGLADA